MKQILLCFVCTVHGREVVDISILCILGDVQEHRYRLTIAAYLFRLKVHRSGDFEVVFSELDFSWRSGRLHNTHMFVLLPTAGERSSWRPRGRLLPPTAALQSWRAGQGRPVGGPETAVPISSPATAGRPFATLLLAPCFSNVTHSSAIFLATLSLASLHPLLGSHSLTPFPWQPLLESLSLASFAWQLYYSTLSFADSPWSPFLGTLLFGSHSLKPFPWQTHLGALSLAPFCVAAIP